MHTTSRHDGCDNEEGAETSTLHDISVWCGQVVRYPRHRFDAGRCVTSAPSRRTLHVDQWSPLSHRQDRSNCESHAGEDSDDGSHGPGGGPACHEGLVVRGCHPTGSSHDAEQESTGS